MAALRAGMGGRGGAGAWAEGEAEGVRAEVGGGLQLQLGAKEGGWGGAAEAEGAEDDASWGQMDGGGSSPSSPACVYDQGAWREGGSGFQPLGQSLSFRQAR